MYCLILFGHIFDSMVQIVGSALGMCVHRVHAFFSVGVGTHIKNEKELFLAWWAKRTREQKKIASGHLRLHRNTQSRKKKRQLRDNIHTYIRQTCILVGWKCAERLQIFFFLHGKLGWRRWQRWCCADVLIPILFLFKILPHEMSAGSICKQSKI